MKEPHKLEDALRDHYQSQELTPQQLEQLQQRQAELMVTVDTPRKTKFWRLGLLAACAAALLAVVGLRTLGTDTAVVRPKHSRAATPTTDHDDDREKMPTTPPVVKKLDPQRMVVINGKTQRPRTTVTLNTQPQRVAQFEVRISTSKTGVMRFDGTIHGRGPGGGGYVRGLFGKRQGFKAPPGIEQYSRIAENGFRSALGAPLSTFSVDVDTASYSNLRRFLNQERMPPKDAVRIEELINYFDYGYAEPKGEHPLRIVSELAPCPWNGAHRLLHIGLQARRIPVDKLPASNLVFLLDVSGSMMSANKLPLVKSSMRLLVQKLRAQDRVAIVVYAGNAGLVLPSTPGSDKERILQAIDRLSAGGSTAGGAGIRLAYKVALAHFKKDGNNRLILATDGDFNVGVSSTSELLRLVEKKRTSGIYLTVLGFGMGNLKDNNLETLADKGNGNYAYIDTLAEARKVLVKEFGGTMHTIANDVKIQVEFNPTRVRAYRLIGYENRMLKKEDFNNDKKDAGEMGSGHTVTALYEIVPVGAKTPLPNVDKLKYQRTRVTISATTSTELATVKLRYKHPRENKSLLLSHPVRDGKLQLPKTSIAFRFSAAVAQFGMLLRDSKHKGQSSYAAVMRLAKGALGEDPNGYRAGFIKLVEQAARLNDRKKP